ncbi:SDR family oxidoreductase [Cytobacillus suaedae]|nr:SDR family oxidoreductase [Cytobacillus suaedae]
MKVCVIGANGQIGKLLVDLLQDSEAYTVRAMVRKDEQVEFFKSKGVETVVASLADGVDQVAEAIRGCDAVVFTAGSGGQTGYDQTLLVDLDGAVKTVEAAEKVDVNRFVMVSALGANARDTWNEKLRPYYVAKHYADRALVQSTLNYTIVRPGALLNEEGTGKVTVGPRLDRGSVTRADVAKVVFESLTEENTHYKGFDLVNGVTPVRESLKGL